MESDILAVIEDTRLSPYACRIVLHVASLGDGPHEVSHREFARLLQNPGEKALRAAIQDAVDLYLDRAPGGRNHHDRYTFRSAPGATLKDRAAPRATLSDDRSAPGATLNRASSTPTDLSPSPSPTARVLPPDTDVARMRAYLGEHARALDMMLETDGHPPTWIAALMGKYGPSGTQERIYAGIPPGRQPAVLATAMMEYAGKVFENRHFDGFMRKAVDSERQPADQRGTGTDGRGANRPPSAGMGSPQRQPPASGRYQFKYE
jgi:hypothetical protein